MIEHTLGGFQLPPALTQEIMHRITNVSAASGPTSKPLLTWMAATGLTAVMLLVGLGVTTTRFQLPYSLNAPESAKTVEIVDAPIIEMPAAKVTNVKRTGASKAGAAGNGNWENGSIWAAAADSRNDTESGSSGWTQTNGPYGGHVTALHATPEGILFAGTIEGGIFRSSDGGETWGPANEGLRVYEDKALPSIFAFAQEENILYAGTGGDLFYSTNGSASWRKLTRLREDLGITSVALISDALYIGRPEKGIFRSDDGGESWTPINDGLIYTDIQRLIVSGRTLFAKTPDSIFRLKAGEISWTKLVIVDAWKLNTAESKITGFAVAGDIIYAATADGDLLRSRDMGDWWKSIKPKKSIRYFDGELAAVGNTIFHIGSGSSDGRVFRSNDGGGSWTMFNTGLINQSIQSITALSEKTLYVGTVDGVFRSTDGGESWARTNTGIINTYIDNLVFFGNALYTIITGEGIVKSVDGGTPWVPANDGLIASNGGTLTVSDGNLYAATNETNMGTWNPATSGIYRLADDGNAWLPIRTNMQSAKERMYSVDQLALAGKTFYAIAQMGQGQRLFRWRAGETLWTDLGLNDLQWGTLAVSGSTVYVSAGNRQLIRSVDDGDRWTDVSRRLPNWEWQSKRSFREDAYDLVFVGGTIYANSDDGVFRLRDGGETWATIVSGLPDGGVDIQLVDGTTLYGTSYFGVFRLTHGSDSWEKIASLMQPYVPSRYVYSLAFDGTTLYAGTAAEGVFRLSLEK
ncbi:MAG: hypothetical protein OXP71_08240 [Candidatus Poribacteria bacterium]|nr:hypothetical protein [Candidatus Poribacteria bacterium]